MSTGMRPRALDKYNGGYFPRVTESQQGRTGSVDTCRTIWRAGSAVIGRPQPMGNIVNAQRWSHDSAHSVILEVNTALCVAQRVAVQQQGSS